MDRSGDLLVADTGNDCIRKVTFSGSQTAVVSTLINGSVTPLIGAMPNIRSQTGDGQPGAAVLVHPSDVQFGADGSAYITDGKAVRKLTYKASGTPLLSTLAGGGLGLSGFVDGPASISEVGSTDLAGVAVDASGCVYVADPGNGLIRKILP